MRALFFSLLSLLCISNTTNAFDSLPEPPNETPDTGGPPAESTEEEEQPLDDKVVWSGMALAYPSGNSTEGLGFGLGAQLYSRPRSLDTGFKTSITASLYANARFDYTYNYIRFENNGAVNWQAMIAYYGWKNLPYTGVGGQATLLDRGDREFGNLMVSPVLYLSGSRKLAEGQPWAMYAQAYLRYTYAVPGEGSLLEETQPLGIDKSIYGDIALGVTLNTTNHWPLPDTGWSAELGTRFGLTFSQRQMYPLVSIQTQLIRWQPLWKHHIVVGVRIAAEKSFGERPFFEQDRIGLQWRDTLGEDQLFLGYGKNRSRGDGLFATCVELRAQFGHHHHKFWDLTAYLSVFAEEGFLFDKETPGPHLPTVGVGPVILFQHAIVLRPFLAWGWRADNPNDPRKPVPMFGFSLLDPL